MERVYADVIRAALLAVVAAGALPAQTPDSIHALRVDPAAYRGRDYVLLLEDGHIRLEADGRTIYTLRQVAQILTPDGVNQWGELAFLYTPGRQRATLNWARVIGPDGTVLRDGPAHQQETTPQVEPGAPVYSDRRTIQATLGAVAPGTLVDYQYTFEIVTPWLPGDFLYSWNLNGWVAVRRSRLVLDTPADQAVRIRERNLRVPVRDVTAGGRRIRTWTDAELDAVDFEYYSGRPDNVIMSVTVGGPVAWRDIGAWYQTLARDRYALSPEVLAAHRAEVAAAGTLDDSLRRTQRWVAQDFRYVSLSLGDGGYQPRSPAEVLQTRFGDCKDKTTLFVSLARRMGVTAYPVLVHSEVRVDTLVPSVSQFDHVIAAVERGGRTTYIDLTAELSPYGELPGELHNAAGLALPDAGPRIVVLPAAPPEQNRFSEDVTGVIGLDGRLVGKIVVTATGTEQYNLRGELSGLEQQDQATRDETLRQYALGVYTSAVLDSARHTDGRDLTQPPSVTVWFTAPNVIGEAGNRYYFNLPLSSFVSTSAISQLEAAGPRRVPIDAALVNSPSVYRSSLEFQLPDGWKADLPSAVSVAGAFGYYRAEFRQAGRTFRASREMGGRRGVEPPDSARALLAWLKAVAQDNTEMIMMERGSGGALVASAEDAPGALGRLPDLLVRKEDFVANAKQTSEGPIAGAGAMLVNSSFIPPVEALQRSFGADQMVFTLGGSQLMTLEASAAAYHSYAQAGRPLGMAQLVDFKVLMEAYFRDAIQGQMSIGASRSIPLDSIGDRAAGWIMELVTPFATFELAFLMGVRGRVATVIFAAGPKGLRDEDLAGLLRVMDRRIGADADYLKEVPYQHVSDLSEPDSALAADGALPLNTIPVAFPDSTGQTASTATYYRIGGWPTYRVRVQGRGLVFPLAGHPALSAVMVVTQHDNEAQALKRVLSAERQTRTELVREVMYTQGMETMSTMVDKMVDSATRVDALEMPGLGSRSIARRAVLTKGLLGEMSFVIFARGRISGLAVVSREPGVPDSTGVAELARAMDRQIQAVIPGARGGTPSARTISALRRVADAEYVVDSLVEARNFDAAFKTVEEAGLAQAPAGFLPGTWNNLCWYAALHGRAQRALAACDAAVAPDSTNLAIRDSRGLARALAGDLEGARADFEYVVANAAPGPWLDGRAAWLDALRAGTSPFTEEVLKELREQ
jgi:transglutaminase-like putative cysteine protease